MFDKLKSFLKKKGAEEERNEHEQGVEIEEQEEGSYQDDYYQQEGENFQEEIYEAEEEETEEENNNVLGTTEKKEKDKKKIILVVGVVIGIVVIFIVGKLLLFLGSSVGLKEEKRIETPHTLPPAPNSQFSANKIGTTKKVDAKKPNIKKASKPLPTPRAKKPTKVNLTNTKVEDRKVDVAAKKVKTTVDKTTVGKPVKTESKQPTTPFLRNVVSGTYKTATAAADDKPANVFSDIFLKALDGMLIEKQKELNELARKIENAQINLKNIEDTSKRINIERNSHGNVRKVSVDLKPIKVQGISCFNNKCVAYTSSGVLSEGMVLGKEEKILKITEDEIVTNYRTVKYYE